MTLALLLEQLFNGVQFGLMLFLMAVGVTLVFGIMRVINLAHGALFMLGGYFLMAALAWTQSYALAVPLARDTTYARETATKTAFGSSNRQSAWIASRYFT